MRPFQFHLQERWRFLQSLETLLPWSEISSPRVVAKSCKCGERFRPLSQRPQYPALYRRLKQRVGCSLRASVRKGSVVRQGKKSTHKCFRVEGGFSGSSKVQGPVPKPNSVGYYGQLNSSSLHKQTRRNPLGRYVHSSVEDYDLVPSLSDVMLFFSSY